MILEKIWRGRYAAESEKAIRDRWQGASGERKRRYAARARARARSRRSIGGGDSRVTLEIALPLLSRRRGAKIASPIGSLGETSARSGAGNQPRQMSGRDFHAVYHLPWDR